MLPVARLPSAPRNGVAVPAQVSLRSITTRQLIEKAQLVREKYGNIRTRYEESRAERIQFINKLNAEVAELSTYKVKYDRVQETQKALDKARDDEPARVLLQKTEAELKQAQQQLAELPSLRTQVADTTALLCANEDRLADSNRGLQQTQEALAATEQQLAEAQQQGLDLQQQLDVEKQQRYKAQQALRELEANHTELLQQHHGAEAKAVETLKEQVAALVFKLQAMIAAKAQLQATVDGLREAAMAEDAAKQQVQQLQKKQQQRHAVQVEELEQQLEAVKRAKIALEHDFKQQQAKLLRDVHQRQVLLADLSSRLQAAVKQEGLAAAAASTRKLQLYETATQHIAVLEKDLEAARQHIKALSADLAAARGAARTAAVPVSEQKSRPSSQQQQLPQAEHQSVSTQQSSMTSVLRDADKHETAGCGRQQQQQRRQQRQVGGRHQQQQPLAAQNTKKLTPKGKHSSSSSSSRSSGNGTAAQQQQQHNGSQAVAGQPPATAQGLTATASPGKISTMPNVAGPSQPESVPAQQQQQQQHPVGFQATHPANAELAAVTADAAAAAGAALQPQSSSSSSAVVDLQGDLQPWMLQYEQGILCALDKLVVDKRVRAQLQALVEVTPEEQLVTTLRKHVKGIIQNAIAAAGGHVEGREALAAFADLVVQAYNELPRQQPHAAAATTGDDLNMLSALNQPQQQQQRSADGGVQPATAVQQLLPHLQQTQQQQRQPAAATVERDASNEDDILLALLSGGAAEPQQQQQQRRQAWGSAQQHQQQQLLPSSEFPPLSAAAPDSGPALAVRYAGLYNAIGENNCFVNALVQCLYRCKPFRDAVRDMSIDHKNEPVVHALLQLFEEMHAAEQGWRIGQERATVNPRELREALDSNTRYRSQEMNDGNELIHLLFDCFKDSQGLGSGDLIDSVFGLKVNQKVCCTCGVTSHVMPSHWEHVFMMNTMALGDVAKDAIKEDGSAEMGLALGALFNQDFMFCDRDVGGCGAECTPKRQCEQSPRVLTLQVVWNAIAPVTGKEIGDTLQYVSEVLDIRDIYADVLASDTVYQLSSAVAYSGLHYVAFVRNETTNQWLKFDDAKVSVVGSWEAVKMQCVKGGYLFGLLFYQVARCSSSSSSRGSAAAAATATATPAVPYRTRQPVAAAGVENAVHWAAAGVAM